MRKSIPDQKLEISQFFKASALLSAMLLISGVLACAQGREPVVAANQVGYRTDLPKRFTAPLTADGVGFTITPVGGDRILYTGEIIDHVRDFSDFQPADSGTHYIIRVEGGDLEAAQSDPFLIREELYQEQFLQSAVAASWVLEENEAVLRDRIRIAAVGSLDHLFGRNPKLAAAPSRPEQGFPEVERGWPIEHPVDKCARLETVRGSISTLPGTEMYPYNPDGEYRHAEGWVNYGAAWCISLSYLAFDRMQTSAEL